MDSSDAAPPPPSDPSARARSRRRHAGSSVPVSPVAPLAHAVLLVGATAGVALAGSLAQGSLGVFLVCAGVAMVAFPPRVKVEWRLWLAAAAVAGCAALSLLPEHTVPQPAWRQALDSTPPIIMPGTISVTPALTVFWLTMLVVTLLTGLFTLAQPVRSRWLLPLVLAAALVVGVYAALAIYARETGWHCALLGQGSEFGFFPSRNQTATFLFAGSLVALGILGTVLREGRWVAGGLAAAVMAACVAGLAFFSPSRGGIVFLLVGVLFWLAGLGRQHRDRRLVVSFAALLLVSGVAFTVSGGVARDRLLGGVTPAPVAAALATTTAPSGEALPGQNVHDLRWKIYRDAADAIRDLPLTGVGLGTFALVFPQYRHAARSETYALHPESDWVLFTIEAGIPAALCLLTLLVLAGGRLKAEREHTYWPLRWGCAVAAVTATLHGTVDVPLHVPPLGWWVLLVAGLALQSSRAVTGGRSRVQHALFIAGGVTALMMGGWLVRAQWFGGPPTTPVAYGPEIDEFYRVLGPDPSRALQMVRQIAREHPMDEFAYRLLGETLCLFDHTEADVDAAFRAERLLEPNLTATPLQQGKAWLDIDPARTAKLWDDALTRCLRNYRAAGLSQHGTPVHFFADMLVLATKEPAVQAALWSEVGRGPEYAFAWVENTVPAQAREGIARLSVDEDFLRKLDAAGQRRFLRDWYHHGDVDALTGFLQGRSEWAAAAWPVRLRRMADTGQPEQAVREGSAHYGIPLALPEPGSGDDATPSAAQETDDPAGAFLAYWKGGNVRSARRVLDEALGHAQGSQLAELWRLKTGLAVRDADWPAAWRSLEQAIGLAHPGEIL